MLEQTIHKCLVCKKEHHREYDRYFCSEECEKRWDAKFKWEQERTHYSDEGVICPYCEDEYEAGGDYPELYDECIDSFECRNCGKEFSVEAHMSWSWTSKPLDNDYPELEDIEEEEEK
ncbi:MAG: hypothetical protein QXM38_04680 [Candidatus Aenigmatarchaeota archaeon]